jgi:hypothetical protein
MKTARILALVLGAAFATGLAHAECYGTGTVQTCYDAQSGNSYTVTRIGQQTDVQGYNAQTGSNWSQTSTHIGNSTLTNGLDSQGRSWNETTTRVGSTIIQDGTNANGQPFSNTQYVGQSDDE